MNIDMYGAHSNTKRGPLFQMCWVGVLFSTYFKPQSVELHHIMGEHILMVKAFDEDVKLVFVCTE